MSKAKEISALYKDIKQQMGKLVSLCHEVEAHAEATEAHAEVTADAYQRGYEQGRKEAYAEGYKEGIQLSIDDAKLKEAYKKGLSDAWDTARKICAMDSRSRDEIFGAVIITNILDHNSASKALEEIRAHEQAQKEKEEQIQAGDEVENTQTGVKFIVTHIWENNRGEQGVSGFNQECSSFSTALSLVFKTGRHFPEIAEVMRKMKEG